MVSPAVEFLRTAQNAAGAWGWQAGRAGNTECTALALLALHVHRSSDASDVIERGVAWLHNRQYPEGSWPVGDQVPTAGWMTSLAVLALARLDEADLHARRGADWLLGRKSRRVPLLFRAWLRLRQQEPAVEQDQNLVGWPWTADTAAWVEPTAWSLLAVKQLQGRLPRQRVAERIRQGEQLLADRMCRGGGWNYGNRRILGEDLLPFPDTTALALMALHDSPSAAVTGVSIDRLHDMRATNRSALVLALATLSLQLYGENVTELRAELHERIRSGPGDDDVRTLALMLLALDDESIHFRVNTT
jgi:hypothetical protein